jgi:hypothetical protein
MQLMPQTASSLGVLNAFPKQNIEGGVRHLRYLIDRYPANLPLEPVPGYPALRRDAGLRAQGPPAQEAAAAYSHVIYLFQDNASSTMTYTNVPPTRTFRLR